MGRQQTTFYSPPHDIAVTVDRDGVYWISVDMDCAVDVTLRMADGRHAALTVPSHTVTPVTWDTESMFSTAR